MTRFNDAGRDARSAEKFQGNFAAALCDPDLPPPAGLCAPLAPLPLKRFAVYRNNVAVGLVDALAARFPATQRILGQEFFRGAARIFAAARPPRSPLMMTYGDAFPAFLAEFPPAAEVPYVADVARLEAARTRAYHAADAAPLEAAALETVAPQDLGALCFTLHPSLEIIASPFPIVAIWARNAGEIPFSEEIEWRGENALVLRPQLEVEVRRLPAGAEVFLDRLGAGEPLAAAAEAALAANTAFDLGVNLAALFSAGLAVAMRREGEENLQAEENLS